MSWAGGGPRQPAFGFGAGLQGPGMFSRCLRRAVRLGMHAIAASGATVAVAAPGFEQALEATPIGQRPASAYFLVPLLTAQGQPERAEQLRRELWRLQIERLQGAATPPGLTVGQLLAAGAQLPDNFGPPWEYAYNVAAGLRLPSPDIAGGRLRISLSNRAPDPLPLAELRLRFGSEANGVTLPCRTDPAPPDIHAAYRQTVAPGQTVELSCELPDDTRSHALLPVLLSAARDGGEPPRLLPGGLQAGRPQPDRWLWQLWGRIDDPLAAWQRRWKAAQLAENAGRAWQPATWPDPPELQPLPPTLSQRVGARSRLAWERALPLLIIGSAAWALFFIVRLTAMRRASPAAQGALCLALAMGGSVLWLVVGRGRWYSNSSGEAGWGLLGLWIAVLSLGMAAAVLAMLMLRLHALLDDERRSWWQTIAEGWQRALQLSGNTTAGQFWGFVAFATWAWGLAAPWGQPWNQMVLAAVGLPLITVTLRRLASLTAREWGTLLAVLAILVAEHWL